jgi:hypothetical protein
MLSILLIEDGDESSETGLSSVDFELVDTSSFDLSAALLFHENIELALFPMERESDVASGSESSRTESGPADLREADHFSPKKDDMSLGGWTLPLFPCIFV